MAEKQRHGLHNLSLKEKPRKGALRKERMNNDKHGLDGKNMWAERFEQKKGTMRMRKAECGTRNKLPGHRAHRMDSLVDGIHGTGGNSRATPPISTHPIPIR